MTGECVKGFIVTGTDTGIGKTVFAAGLVAALARRHGRARYWKPVQAGLDGETDSATVARLAPDALIHPEAYRLTTPVSPHLAAAIDSVTIFRERLALPVGLAGLEDAPLVVEGAGGALVPMVEGDKGGQTLLIADLFAAWRLPVVVVARTGLGTINHCLLTIEALRARGCILAGIAFVGDAHAENERVIPAISGVPRLGRLPWLAPLDAASLAAAMDRHFDLSGLT